MKKSRDFAQYIRSRLAADPDLAEAVQRESFNAEIASQIYEARTEAGLTQKQLADRIGTQQSVISRLENADYDGHSLNMLKRIGDALGKRLRIGFDSKPELPDPEAPRKAAANTNRKRAKRSSRKQKQKK